MVPEVGNMTGLQPAVAWKKTPVCVFVSVLSSCNTDTWCSYFLTVKAPKRSAILDFLSPWLWLAERHILKQIILSQAGRCRRSADYGVLNRPFCFSVEHNFEAHCNKSFQMHHSQSKIFWKLDCHTQEFGLPTVPLLPFPVWASSPRPGSPPPCTFWRLCCHTDHMSGNHWSVIGQKTEHVTIETRDRQGATHAQMSRLCRVKSCHVPFLFAPKTKNKNQHQNVWLPCRPQIPSSATSAPQICLKSFFPEISLRLIKRQPAPETANKDDSSFWKQTYCFIFFDECWYIVHSTLSSCKEIKQNKKKAEFSTLRGISEIISIFWFRSLWFGAITLFGRKRHDVTNWLWRHIAVTNLEADCGRSLLTSQHRRDDVTMSGLQSRDIFRDHQFHFRFWTKFLPGGAKVSR